MLRVSASLEKHLEQLLAKTAPQTKQGIKEANAIHRVAQAAGTPVQPTKPSEPYKDTTPRGLGNDNGSFGGE